MYSYGNFFHKSFVFFSGQLLSDWPPKYSRFKRRQTPPIDPEVLKNMRMKQFIGHAPKPPHILRNQVPYDLEKDRWEGVPESPMMRGEPLLISDDENDCPFVQRTTP